MSIQDSLESVKVEDIMSTHVIFVNKDDPLPFVIKLFERTQISGAPVMNKGGEYVGVISKTDLTRLEVLKGMVQNYNIQGADSITIKHFMNPNPPITIFAGISAKQAAEVMLEKKIHRVFVTDSKGLIIGVVSSFDIVKAFAGESSFVTFS